MQGILKVTTPTDREIVITRQFNAPREAVWDALTNPTLLRQWLFSPPGWELVTCEEDVRPGGAFRWAWAADGKTVMEMHGEYQEAAPPGPDGAGGRLVRSESGCLPQGGALIATIELGELPGARQTVLTMTLLYPTREARDMMIEMGMTQGMEAGYERLDAMLGT